MNELKRLMQDMKENAELKKAVEDAQQEIKSTASPDGKLTQENLGLYQDAVINVAKNFGYAITRNDFTGGEEGELDEGELAAVAGGNFGVCLLSSCGCMVFGEINGTGGCVVIGAWRD